MKTPSPDPRWDPLLRQARADSPPPADLSALLQAVRRVPAGPVPGWTAEFALLFNSAGLVPACLVGSFALTGFTIWQVWSVWQALPWAELLSTTTGGVP